MKLMFVTCAVLACTLAAARSSQSIDLDRDTPVPANEEIPVADFFRPPLFAEPKLNSSGSHFIALVETGSDSTALLIYDFAKSKMRVIGAGSGRDVYTADWLDSKHVICSTISEKKYAQGLFVVDVDKADAFHTVEAFSATNLVGVPVEAPMRPLLWVFRNAYDDGKDTGVVRIDAAKDLNRNKDAVPGSFQARHAQEGLNEFGVNASVIESFPAPGGGGIAVAYLPDMNGGLAFAVTAQDGVYTLHRLSGKRWEKCPVDLDEIEPVDAGDKEDELIVIGPQRSDKPRALMRLDAVTGGPGEVLLQDAAYDPADCTLYRSPVTRKVIGARFSKGVFQSVWFDASYSSIQKMLNRNFPGQVVKLLGSDPNERRFLFSAYSDRQPVVYYLLDLDAKSFGIVKGSMPWIDPSRMNATNVLKFQSRDGHSLEGYLTLPAGASKEKPAPLVVLPHGGPHVRDVWGYDGEVQFLASRGYAVLQPNYRGSSGYGWMFSGNDEWDFRKMHDDVTDAVDTVLKTGLIDPDRMAIMGSSFGGYLALCGAAFEPGRYRCAVTIAGVFDWERVLNEKKSVRYESAAYGIFSRNLGNPKTNREAFDRISPLRHIDQVRVPVFVAHGRDDRVADVSESKALIKELGKFNVPNESMLVSGEGHGMNHARNQVELYARIEEFLAKNLAKRK